MAKAQLRLLEVAGTNQGEHSVSQNQMMSLLLGLETRLKDPYDPRITAFQALPMPALIVDSRAAITACNADAAALLGLPEEAVIGHRWWDFISVSSPSNEGDAEKFILRTSGGTRTIIVQRIPLTGNSTAGPVLLLLQVERRYRHKQDTDAQLNTSILDVAHELRSPLQSFNLALSSLADAAHTLSAADHKRLLGALQRSSVHLQTLVENLLDAASLDDTKYNLIVDSIDISLVIREAAAIVDPLLQPGNQHIKLMLPEAPLNARGDAQRLRQVLVNLLHNAIKYGPRNETILVRARRRQGEILVTVTDQGPGIPEEEQAHIFERYYRGRTASSMGHGNGLGLAISRTAILAHGGSIGVRNEVRRGTTFWFALPMQR
jgi:signal transduction histidine kinase